jgi:hypothetical protein
MRLGILIGLVAALLAGCWVASGQVFVGRPLRPLTTGSIIATNDLLAYYKYDETSGMRVNSQGNTNFNLIDNSSGSGGAGSAAGIITNAVVTATGAFLEQEITEFSFRSNSFSIFFWVYPTSAVTGTPLIYGNATTIPQYVLQVIANGSVTATLQDDSTAFFSASKGAGSAPTNTWTFIYFQYVNNGISTNGVLSISVNAGAFTSTTNAAGSSILADRQNFFNVGRYLSATTADFQGRIDEMAIMRRILTTNEIAEVYRGGLGVTCCNPGFYVP